MAGWHTICIVAIGIGCITLNAVANDEGIPRKTGNLTITSYRQVLMMQGGEPQSPDPMLTDPTQIQQMGVSSVEDYVTLDIVMPEKDKVDFTPHLANAELVRELGLSYAIYPWVHFYPDWVAEEPGFTPYTNLADGSTCRQPSGWAPFTHELMDRFYAAMAEHLGEYVEAVYVTDTVEYGEIGYPIGYTQWLRPDPNAQPAWWCGDAYARADFRAEMQRLYGDFEALNARWGADFESEEDITYPPLSLLEPRTNPRELMPEQRSRILDFVYWYQDAGSRRMQDFAAIARRHFPDRDYEVKLGHGDEMALSGHSYTSNCRALKEAPGMAIRSTHAAVSYFHVKRVATPARFYGFDFLTEPPGTVPPERMAERIFTDACVGVNAYFDYPQNPAAALETYNKYITLLDAKPAQVKVALFFPEADHYLHIDRPYPPHLIESALAIRDVADFDVVDERLIAEGALNRYAILVVVGDPLIKESTADAFTTALERDNPLQIIRFDLEELAAPDAFTLVNDETRTLPIPGDRDAAVMDVNALPRPYDPNTTDAALAVLQEAYGEVLGELGLSNTLIELLTTRNGVWTGFFEHRVLAINMTGEPVELAGEMLEPLAIQEWSREELESD